MSTFSRAAQHAKLCRRLVRAPNHTVHSNAAGITLQSHTETIRMLCTHRSTCRLRMRYFVELTARIHLEAATSLGSCTPVAAALRLVKSDMSFRTRAFSAGEEPAVQFTRPCQSLANKPKRVIPSGVARPFLPRSLLRTSRATQSRNLSSIDRGAKPATANEPKSYGGTANK